MRKKLIFLLFGALMLTGCGAAASDAVDGQSAAPNGSSAAGTYGLYSGEGISAASVEPEEVPAATELSEPAECALDYGGQTGYFTFTRGSAIATADDGTELLYEYTCDTEFVSLEPETQVWVDSVLEEIRRDYASNSGNLLKSAQERLKLDGASSFYSYSNYQELGVARHDSKVVSLLVLSSVYSGGAHPNTVQTAWNLDMETRTVLAMEDVICEEGAQSLADMVQLIVEDKFLSLGEGALLEDYAETIQGSFVWGSMTPYWYLNDTGLVIFFNQYELGPYAAGIIKAEIPYESLEGILREEYFPGNYGQLPGDLLLRSDWEGCRKIPITVESDGEQILIGVEGEVRQIQLSEVSWLEGTAIGQKMLFSADCLTERDVIELTGGYDDESRSFAIEFTDGQGNVTIYYIHPEGLTTAP